MSLFITNIQRHTDEDRSRSYQYIQFVHVMLVFELCRTMTEYSPLLWKEKIAQVNVTPQ